MALTNDELLEVLRKAGAGERAVEMSNRGIWLKTKAGAYEISLDQADVLWSTMFGHANTATV